MLDPERAQLFARSLQDWIQEDEPAGINSSMAIFSSDHRLRIYRESHQTDELRLGWGISSENGSTISPIPMDEIPGYLRPYLQDWIDAAQAGPAGETKAEPRSTTSP